MNKKIRRIILVFGVLLVLILIGIYAAAKHFGNNIRQLEVGKLEEIYGSVDKLLFQTNPYLAPDTAYFQKLEHLLSTGKLPKEEKGADDYIATTTGMILKNLSKGASLDSNIYSVYTLLAEESAPYLLVNGKLRSKIALNDQEYWNTCSGMEGSCYADWRRVSSSYLNQVDVFTVYRSYDSTHYMTGEIIRGYMVINYYRSHILNEINALIDPEVTVAIYHPGNDEILYAGREQTREEDIRRLLIEDGEGGILRKNGSLASGRNENLIYGIYASEYAPVYYLVVKNDAEISRFMGEIYMAFLLIIISFCLIAMSFILMYYRQYRNYLTGLVQVIKAAEKEEISEENAMTKLVTHMKEPETNLDFIAKKIMNDNFDINELKKALNSERTQRTEVEMLYGHAQINSHFLLNSLDTIYWESLKNNGVENDETKMLEMLCTILKYALDSSNPYTSLEEEVACARNYLMIQQMRKNRRLEAEWRIPEQLLSASVGKLTLQPILENSIQHGMHPDPGIPVRIVVEAKLIDNTLYLSVSDNGKGMDEAERNRMNDAFRKDKPVRSKHIGLQNVNRRIQLQYGEEYGIVLQPARQGNGLKVIIRLKYITAGESSGG